MAYVGYNLSQTKQTATLGELVKTPLVALTASGVAI